LNAQTPPQPPIIPAPTEAPATSHSLAVQAGALALALMLGFGAGITFEQGRHTAAPAAGRMADEAQTPAPSPAKAAPAPEAAPAAPKIPPLAAVAPRTPAAQVPAPPPPASQLSPPQAAAPQPAAPKPAPPQPAAPQPLAAVTPAPPASAPTLPSYRFVIRYEKNGAFAFDVGAGKFENVVAARASALAECQARGGHNCKFNYATAGHCIGVARPPQGPFRVSQLEPSEASAANDAVEQCEFEYQTSCRVVKVLCQEP
jgi:hypothetical protein